MRLRIGFTHPLPFFKNAGIYAKDLNAKDTATAQKAHAKFEELANMLAALLPEKFGVVGEQKQTDPGTFEVKAVELKGMGFAFVFYLS